MTKKEALRLVKSLRRDGKGYSAARELLTDESNRFSPGVLDLSKPDNGLSDILESLAYSYNGDIA